MSASVHLSAHLRSGELEACELIKSKRFDSFILHSDFLTDQELAELMDVNPNVILLNRRISEYHDRCVSTDSELGGVLAAEYLLKNNHTALAMVAGPSTSSEVRLRTAGFLKAVKEKGDGIPEPLLLESDFSEVGGLLAMDKICEHPRPISAVFFQNDAMAIGALGYCHEHSINVPNGISIVGFDGLRSSRFVYPTLTTIRQPLRSIGREAARIASTLIGDGKGSTVSELPTLLFEPSMVEGETVKLINNPNEVGRLTRREKECLEWAARGKTGSEIAKVLNISTRTVDNHLSNSFKRLNVTNRSEAIARSIREGLIDVD